MIFQKLIDKDRLTQEIRQSSIVTALDYINNAGTNCEIGFKAALSDADTSTLNKIVANHLPVPLPVTTIQSVAITNNKLTPSGRPGVAIFEPEGASATIVSHDFCNKTSWWMTSLPIAMETLTVSQVPTVYTASKQFIIDMTHGHCYDEDTYTAADPTLIPKVYVGGVLQTSGYTVDYRAGTVTFAAVVSGSVQASYRYAVDSYFILKPRAGQVLSIKSAQVQFATDVLVNVPIIFEAWVTIPNAGTFPIPGTKIKYKNEKDFIASCNGGQQTIKAWGTCSLDTIILSFDYARPKPMKSSAQVQIRIYVQGHTELVGSLANGTFYVTSETESV